MIFLTYGDLRIVVLYQLPLSILGMPRLKIYFANQILNLPQFFLGMAEAEAQKTHGRRVSNAHSYKACPSQRARPNANASYFSYYNARDILK